MSGPRIAVVDQGSTGTKGALVDGGGRTLAEAAVAVERRERGDRVEHDPAALADGVEAILVELGAGRADAIGLTCQRSTCLVWERASGRPLTPALSWQDRSEAARVEALAAHADTVAARTGLHLSPHYAAPKLARLLGELPRGRERAASGELVAGTLDAFLLHRLTGAPSTEPGHAGRSLLFDLERGDWDEELCELFGVPAAALPALTASAVEKGRWRGVPVTATAGDQQAALVGHGGWRGGVVAAHFGTGAFVLASCGGRPLRRSGLLSAVLASTSRERRFQLEGSVNSAGSAVDWARRLTGERLDEWTERELDPAAAPRVLPALAGLAAPWWRPGAKGVVAALEPRHGGAELFAGVLAGVAHRVLDCVEAIAAAGVEVATVRVSGKLTRLGGLVGLLADAGGWTVEIAAEEETGLAGIARLARAGLDGDASPLTEAAPARHRREPAWTGERAAAERAAWRDFVERAQRL